MGSFYLDKWYRLPNELDPLCQHLDFIHFLSIAVNGPQISASGNEAGHVTVMVHNCRTETTKAWESSLKKSFQKTLQKGSHCSFRKGIQIVPFDKHKWKLGILLTVANNGHEEGVFHILVEVGRDIHLSHIRSVVCNLGHGEIVLMICA